MRICREKARPGTKPVVVELELVKEGYNERSETGAFKKSLATPRQGIREEVGERAYTA